VRRPRPSLVRRLTLAFFIGQGLATLLLLFAAYPSVLLEEDEPAGPEVVHAAVARDLVLGPDGRLIIERNGYVEDLVERHPQLWFIATAAGQTLSFGPVPSEMRATIAQLPPGFVSGRFRAAPPSGSEGASLVDRIETGAGETFMAAGGVESPHIDLSTYILLMRHHELFWFPLLSAALTLLGALLAIPVLLRSIRPTTRAAAELDPGDPSRRLPEARVVKQLLPLVRAFNAALDRVSSALERQRRFIADVAHELRTPLAVLNMHVDKLPPGEAKPDLQRTVYRLEQMIGQMLDAERLILAERRHDRVDLVALSRSAVADIAPLAIGSGYEIAVTAAAEAVFVSGDPYALSRALANLLGNAVAHGGGRGTIEVRVSRLGTVDVVDEGPGVPLAARETVFEPFHRERWDRDGCGLGLYLVREIMQAHGGTASLISPGPGAVFRLAFPLRETGRCPSDHA